MRKTNWYFEGWKKEKKTGENGKTKTVWNYQGIYYQFYLEPDKLKYLKAGYLAASLVMIALWFVFSLTFGTGRETAAYVGAPWFLQIIPFMYLIMGVYGTLRAGFTMTYRDIRSGYFRIRVAKWILAALQIICLIGDIIFLIIYHSQIRVWDEIIWIIGLCLCFVCTVVLFILQKKYPPYQIPETA